MARILSADRFSLPTDIIDPMYDFSTPEVCCRYTVHGTCGCLDCLTQYRRLAGDLPTTSKLAASASFNASPGIVWRKNPPLDAKAPFSGFDDWAVYGGTAKPIEAEGQTPLFGVPVLLDRMTGWPIVDPSRFNPYERKRDQTLPIGSMLKLVDVRKLGGSKYRALMCVPRKPEGGATDDPATYIEKYQRMGTQRPTIEEVSTYLTKLLNGPSPSIRLLTEAHDWLNRLRAERDEKERELIGRVEAMTVVKKPAAGPVAKPVKKRARSDAARS